MLYKNFLNTPLLVSTLLIPSSPSPAKMEEKTTVNASQFASLDFPFITMQDPSARPVEKLAKRKIKPLIFGEGKRRKRRLVKKLVNESEHESESAVDCSEGESEEVERKVRKLRRLLPGGEGLGVEKLFEETAEYILVLKEKVEKMKLVASYLERLEKEKTKIGG